MQALRVVLIGGTSHTGKSTVGRALANRLEFDYQPTDLLARHPGRPWRTPEREVPAHVAEHYASLTLDELIASVLEHYERLWPRIEELVTARVVGGRGERGLVLEGSAVWPVRVAEPAVPHTAAVWLTADDAVLRARIHRSGGYEDATDHERHLIDRFLARTIRFQALMLDEVNRLGLSWIDTGDGRSVAELVEAVLAATGAQQAVGRSAHRAAGPA